jgi:hypothetical protein
MARPRPNRLDLPWGYADRCPCGSGRAFGRCCYRRGLAPCIALPSILPSCDKTGYAHPKCYLRGTNNCSTKISAEHYISRTVLEDLDPLGRIKITGFPWSPEMQQRHINDMVANILCVRHNAALSPVDTAARHAFRCMRAAYDHSTAPGGTTKSAFFLFSGEALELWALKTLAGMYFAKISSVDGRRAIDHQRLDIELIEKALSGEGLDRPRGLYLEPHARSVAPEVGIAPLADTARSKICGIALMHPTGPYFDFLIDPEAADPRAIKNSSLYRPTIIDWNGPVRTARCVVSWNSASAICKGVGFDIMTGSLEPQK